MSQVEQPTVVLTIGGSDSGGAAGIQADLKTLAMFGVYGMSAVTVVTAQNSRSVVKLINLPPEFVSAQIEAVLGDYGAQGVKTGFLGSAATVEIAARNIGEYSLENIVVDPVLVNHKGQSMFDKDVTRAYRDYLIPLADIVTPNVLEAELLAGMKISDSSSVRQAARLLNSMGARTSLITGRREGQEIVDLLDDGENYFEFRSHWVDTQNLHGSGDTLSAAICAMLAKGNPMKRSIQKARAFTSAAIAAGKDWRLGGGHGPVSSWGDRRVMPEEGRKSAGD